MFHLLRQVSFPLLCISSTVYLLSNMSSQYSYPSQVFVVHNILYLSLGVFFANYSYK